LTTEAPIGLARDNDEDNETARNSGVNKAAAGVGRDTVAAHRSRLAT
jgi:hypothetical protein